MRISRPTVILLAVIAAATLLTALGYLMFDGLRELITTLLGALKDDNLAGDQAVIAIWDTFLILGVLTTGAILSISQLAGIIQGRPRSRFKDFLEFIGVGLFAFLLFALSTTLVRGESLFGLPG